MAVTVEPLTSGEELSVEDYLGQWLAHVAGRVRPKTLDGKQLREISRRSAELYAGRLPPRHLRAGVTQISPWRPDSAARGGTVGIRLR